MLKSFQIAALFGVFVYSNALQASDYATQMANQLNEDDRMATFRGLMRDRGVQYRDDQYISDWTFSKGLPYSPQLKEHLENRWGESAFVGFAKPRTFGISITNLTGEELGDFELNFDQGFDFRYFLTVRNNTTLHVVGNRAISFLKRIKALSHVSFISRLGEKRRIALAHQGDIPIQLFRVQHLVLFKHNGAYSLQPLGVRRHIKKANYDGSMYVRQDY